MLTNNSCNRNSNAVYSSKNNYTKEKVRKILLTCLIAIVSNSLIVPAIPVHADLGFVWGRDLAYDWANFVGHVGIEDDHGMIYEMLGDEFVTSAWGARSELNYNDKYDFLRRSDFWGKRYAWELYSSAQWYRLNDYVRPNMELAYELGADYTITTITKDPVGYIASDGTRWVEKGEYRCDTFVNRMYETGAIDLGVSIMIPYNVYHAFPDSEGESSNIVVLNNLEYQQNKKLNKHNKSGIDYIRISQSQLPSIQKYQEMSFSGKVGMFENLKRQATLIDQQRQLYNLIEVEENEKLKKEILLILFSYWGHNINLTKEQIKIKDELFEELIKNKETRNIVVNLGIDRVVSNEKLKNLLIEKGHLFTEEQNSSIINSFINYAILNGKNPFSDLQIGDLASKELPEYEDISRRVQTVLSGWIRLTGISDLRQLNSEFYQKYTIKQPENSTEREYVNWIISKTAIMNSESERSEFIINEMKSMPKNIQRRLEAEAGYIKNLIQ